MTLNERTTALISPSHVIYKQTGRHGDRDTDTQKDTQSDTHREIHRLRYRQRDSSWPDLPITVLFLEFTRGRYHHMRVVYHVRMAWYSLLKATQREPYTCETQYKYSIIYAQSYVNFLNTSQHSTTHYYFHRLVCCN